MNRRIDLDWTQKELDEYLRKEYGYRILKFENCLLYAYGFFTESYGTKTKNLYETRISKIGILKKRLYSAILKYLKDLKFFENDYVNYICKQIFGISDWNDKNKELFILKYFKLDAIFMILENQKITYNLLVHRKSKSQKDWNVAGNYRIYPIRFFIIVLSFIMKRGKTVKWTDMSHFLQWISLHYQKKNIKNMFYLYECNVFSGKFLRSIRNRYKNTPYYTMAKGVYLKIFKTDSDPSSFRKDERIKFLTAPGNTRDDTFIQKINEMASVLFSLLPEAPEFKYALESAKLEIGRHV